MNTNYKNISLCGFVVSSFSLAFFLLTIVSSSYAESVLNSHPHDCEGTLVCYQFDNASDFRLSTSLANEVVIADGSTNGISAKVRGIVQRSWNSFMGSASAEFDGYKGGSGGFARTPPASRLELNNPLPIKDHTGALSISTWMYVADIQNKSLPMFIFSMGNFRVGLSKDNKPLIWIPGNPSGSGDDDWRVFSQWSSKSVPVNEWTHVLWEYDPSSKSTSIYINGELSTLDVYAVPNVGASDNYLDAYPSNVYKDTSADVLVGGGYPSDDIKFGSFVGKLDEFKVYGKVLEEEKKESHVAFDDIAIQSVNGDFCATLSRPEYIKATTIKRVKRGEGIGRVMARISDLGNGIDDLVVFDNNFVRILDTDDVAKDGTFNGELTIASIEPGSDSKNVDISADEGGPSYSPSSVAILRDLDSDGSQDIVVGYSGAEQVVVHKLNDNAGQREEASSYSITFSQVANALSETGGTAAHEFGFSVAVQDDSKPQEIKLAVVDRYIGSDQYYGGGGEVFIITIDDTKPDGQKIVGVPIKLSSALSLDLETKGGQFSSVSTIGDLDGNGFQDLVISASATTTDYGQKGVGSLYVVFFKKDYQVESYIEITDGKGGLPLNSIEPHSDFGNNSIRLKKPSNGASEEDAEIYVGNGVSDRGSFFVLRIGKDGNVKDYRKVSRYVSGLTPQDVPALTQTFSLFGSAVTPMDDVNGDGSDDVFVGAPYESSDDISGAVYFLGLSSPSEYVKTGSYRTIISKESSQSWDKLVVEETVPSGATSLKYEIFDSACTKSLIPLSSAVNGSIDLSSLDSSSSELCLKVDFSTTKEDETPKLCSYDVVSEKGSVVSGRSWYDVNENGIQESGESGIFGVKVEIFNSSGAMIDDVLTDGSGNYSFSPVWNGKYYVKFTPPSSSPSFSFSSSGKGDSSTDSDVIHNDGRTAVFTLGKNVELGAIDAGLYVKGQKLVSLGDYVWYDSNKDDEQTAGEGGIFGVKVELLNEDKTKVLSAVSTDSQGHYLFGGVLPGKYNLRFSPHWSGYSLVKANSSSDDDLDSDVSSNGMIEDIVVSSEGKITVSGKSISDGLSLDAGYTSTQSLSSSVKGEVWLDADSNGLKSTGERRLSGVLVELYHVSGASSSLLTGVLTDSSGEYSFENLPPLSYYVKVFPSQHNSSIKSYGFTKMDVGKDDSIDSDIDDSSYDSAALDLSSGSKVVDAGLVLLSGVSPSSLGDYVWMDSNGNGVQDSNESGIKDLEVVLYDSKSRSLSTTTTDSNGFYKFSHLLSGDYIIGVMLPEDYDYGFTIQNASNDDDKDSDVSQETGMTGIISLSLGEDNQSVDIGLSDFGGGVFGSVFQMLWDGQCSDEGKSSFDCVKGNYPALYNNCSSTVDVDVSFYTSDGSLKDSKTFKVESAKPLVLSVHDFKGFSRTSHGFLEFTQSIPGCLDGSMETLSWAKADGFVLGYDAVPIQPLLKKEDCWIIFNTFNPSLVSSDWFIPTQNRLKIANNDSVERDFDVKYYSYSGEELKSLSEKLSVKGKGVREDSILVSNMYGLVHISPSSTMSEGYGSYVYRSGRDGTTAVDELRLNSFTTVNTCLPANDKPKVLPITAQNYRASWLELYNVTASHRRIRLDVYSDDGGFLGGRIIPFKPHASHHFYVGSMLGKGKNGFAVLTPEKGGDFLGFSTTYFYAPDSWDSPFGNSVEDLLFKERVIASQSLPSLLPLGKESKTLYNTHVGNDKINRSNWLRVFNMSKKKSVEVTVSAITSSGDLLKKKLSLSPGGSRHNLNAELNLPDGEMGKITIERTVSSEDSSEGSSEDSSELYGDLLRVDYGDPLFTSVVESESISLR